MCKISCNWKRTSFIYQTKYYFCRRMSSVYYVNCKINGNVRFQCYWWFFQVPSTFSNEIKLLMNLTYPQSKLIITNSTVVPIRELSGFMAIQTDKKLYKKNQKGIVPKKKRGERETQNLNRGNTEYKVNIVKEELNVWMDHFSGQLNLIFTSHYE